MKFLTLVSDEKKMCKKIFELSSDDAKVKSVVSSKRAVCTFSVRTPNVSLILTHLYPSGLFYLISLDTLISIYGVSG